MPNSLPEPLPDAPTLVSPCISVCEIDPVTDLCKGCLRTAAEIGAWRATDRDGKMRILIAIRDRWRAAEPPADDPEVWQDDHDDLGERLELAGLIAEAK